MTWLQYLHEVHRKIRATNERFFKNEEIVSSRGIQDAIDRAGKDVSESKRLFHFFKLSQGSIVWK